MVDKIFVIIVTFNGMKWYDRCFTSLRQSNIPVQTIVVDNASEDGSAQYIKDHFPEIYLIESQENLGFGRANNIAMRYALNQKCDYVFLLNQDTWIEPDSIETLVQLHKNNSQYGILSPMHIRADGKSLYIQIEDGKTDHGNKLLSDCYFNQLDDIYTFSYINAAAWLLPRSTIEIVGGFDPIFPLYGEDDDYLNRLHYHGLKLGLCPKVRVVHDHQNVPNPLSGGRARYYQSLIVGFINPNKQETFKNHLASLKRKIVINFLKGNQRLVKQLKMDYKFLLEKQPAIRKSRSLNKNIGSTWL